MNARAVAGLLLLGVVAVGVVLLARGGPGAAERAPAQPAPTSAAATIPLGGPSTCLPCHAQVVEEWRASMHAVAFTDPQVRAPDQSDNFSKQECLPCHAPAPLFEQGIADQTRVLARVERRADGVDCLGCHAVAGGVAASRDGLQAPCAPRLRAELSTPLMCQSCHNQHNTHDEWIVSPAAAAGQDCLTCHMTRAERTGDEAGAPRTGASHRFPGGRDKDFALAGLSLTHVIEGDTLVVVLSNDFAGHNLPADSRNRALDLSVTVFDARGIAIPPPAGEVRDPGCELGTARLRFRNPYRASGNPNTQIVAGQSAELRVPLPAGATRATIELIYKLQPWIPDREAHWTHTLEVPLTGAP
jgi:Cytochrome c554 and c-prime